MLNFTRNRFTQVIALAATAACFLSAAHATPDTDFNPANSAFQKANAGDTSAISEALEKFNALLQREPTNPLLMVHAGAATAMQARATKLPWKKLSYAEDGMAMQDKALALLEPSHDSELQNGVPLSIQVRFVAASTFLAVPSMFNRGSQGEKLLAEVMASPLFDKAPVAFRSAVWMRAAKLAKDQKRAPDARKYLSLVVTSGGPHVEAAKTEMGGL